MSDGARLQAVQAESGIQYLLEGRPVKQHDPLELRLINGQWLLGRLHWPKDLSAWPQLEIPLGGVWEQRDSSGFRHGPWAWPAAYLQLHGDCIVRWPEHLPPNFAHDAE
jgi:hypothetical protein